MAPDPALITPLGQQFLDDMPPAIRDEPDLRAVWHCQAKEFERIDAMLTELSAQFKPATVTELGLPWWEDMLRLTVNPDGMSVETRRHLVMAFVRRLRRAPAGATWVSILDLILGPGWSYREHDVDNPGDPPPPYTVLVVVPSPPSGTRFAQLERLLRLITPAHLDIQLNFGGGFILDESELDQEGMHY